MNFNSDLSLWNTNGVTKLRRTVRTTFTAKYFARTTRMIGRTTPLTFCWPCLSFKTLHHLIAIYHGMSRKSRPCHRHLILQQYSMEIFPHGILRHVSICPPCLPPPPTLLVIYHSGIPNVLFGRMVCSRSL